MTAAEGVRTERPSIEALLAIARELTLDTDLALARRWRAGGPDRIVLGSFASYFPAEIAEALGVLHIGFADAAMDGMCPLRFEALCDPVRSILDGALLGRLDGFDAFVVQGSCEPARTLLTRLAGAFPRAGVHLLGIPPAQGIRGNVAAWEVEIKHLSSFLERLAGRKLEPLLLRAAIHRRDEQRELLRRLLAYRETHPGRISFAETYSLARLATRCFASEHMRLVADVLAGLDGRLAERSPGMRVVLERALCQPPPLAFLDRLERAGLQVIDDDLLAGARPTPRPRPDGAPMTVLAELYACPARDQLPSPHPMRVERGPALVARVRARGAHGVLFAPRVECAPAEAELAAMRRCLNAAGVPCLVLAAGDVGPQAEGLEREVVRFAQRALPQA